MPTNLDKVKHIVVVMMENRSFDHMLGYLKADKVLPEADDVDGLDPSVHGCPWPDGTPEPVKPMEYRTLHHKVQDPGHGVNDVEAQLANGNKGFLTNYVEVLEENKAKWAAKGKEVPPDDELPPEVVLGYQQGWNVPVYDWIARNFVVCDRWFSSVAGPTWPNRMYAMTGGTGKKDLGVELPGWLHDKLGEAPIYNRPAFTRWLRQDAWRWYSHDPATLRAADSAYRPLGADDLYSDANFAYFNRRTLFERRTFLDDAERGELRSVSWIDPNFVDLRVLGPPGSNDDHPPSRILLGQEFILAVLAALVNSPCWEQTMLVITYDEHGGFYDHVSPGEFKCEGDEKGGYGVRVPALVVSPWADQAVSHTVFDHTSLPKTILTRFADEPSRELAFAQLGDRTRHAKDLGELLTRETPRPAPTDAMEMLLDAFKKWKADTYKDVYAERSTIAEEAFDLVTDLQAEVIGQAALVRGREVPPGKP
jgi:phospholipase C